LTNLHTLKKLKKAAESIKTPISWIRNLSEEGLLELYDWLERGDTMWEIVNKANNAYAKLNNLDGHLQVNELAKFRMALMDDKALIKVQAERGDPEALKIQKKLEEFKSRIDGMGRMSWLIDQQSLRLEGLVAREKKGLPLALTNEVVKSLGNLLSKYIEFQADLGEVRRVPQQHLIGIKTQFEKLDGSAVAKATMQMLELVEKQTVTMEVDDDGQYIETDIELPEVTEQKVLIGE
jgi:hypothetical protein